MLKSQRAFYYYIYILGWKESPDISKMQKENQNKNKKNASLVGWLVGWLVGFMAYQPL